MSADCAPAPVLSPSPSMRETAGEQRVHVALQGVAAPIGREDRLVREPHCVAERIVSSPSFRGRSREGDRILVAFRVLRNGRLGDPG